MYQKYDSLYMYEIWKNTVSLSQFLLFFLSLICYNIAIYVYFSPLWFLFYRDKNMLFSIVLEASIVLNYKIFIASISIILLLFLTILQLKVIVVWTILSWVLPPLTLEDTLDYDWLTLYSLEIVFINWFVLDLWWLFSLFIPENPDIVSWFFLFID